MAMKASLSLEYMVKWVILLVVLLVIVGIIVTWKEDLGSWCEDMGLCSKNTEDGEHFITQATFSSSDVANMAETCWFANKDKAKNVQCYVLEATEGFSASKAGVESALSEEIREKVVIETDFKSKLAYIRFEYKRYRVIIGG